MRKLVIAYIVVGVLLILGFAYYRVGWNRMADGCSSRMHEISRSIGTGTVSVRSGWEFPGGFTCSFSDGTKQQSWWF